MKHLFLINLLIIPFVCILGACRDDEDLSMTSPILNVEPTTLNFETEGGVKEVKVNSNVDWIYSFLDDNVSWCNIERTDNGLSVTVDENGDKGIRYATLCIAASTEKDTINIAQLGWGKAILLSPTITSVPVTGGIVEVEVTTNIEYCYTIEENCDWVNTTSTRSLSDHPLISDTLYFNVDANDGDTQRQVVITFTDIDSGSEVEGASLTVIQDGLENYSPFEADSLKDDIQVAIHSATASSVQSGTGIELSFDGDKDTWYHSSWNNSGDNYFPIVLEYTFEEGSDMDYLVYYPRSDGGKNGNFKEVDIEVLSSANTRGVAEWEYVMTYDFGGSSAARKVSFPKSLIGVSAIRLTINSGAGDGQGFASCAEMEFYKKNPQSFDYATLFTDPSCSELKTGIAESDILSCPYSFFKNIAWYLYHDKYPKEFRIASFRAYPHPDVQAEENKTNAYSLLDNLTGISVQGGETLVVLVDDLYGQEISLRVQNLDEPEGDGFGGDDYPLSEGTNKLSISEKGLVYIMYHTSDYVQAPDVKIHFATGTVNGYYDSQNAAHEGRWQELLANATDDYFDVVGKYAHLTFPTSRFRNHTGNLKTLIDAYDEIVYNEQALMGLDKYNKMFKNRMYFNVIYTSYMYATSYHTAYNDNTLSELCTEDLLTTSSCWGPAHEVGHCNQTRPGLRWLGMTEVTNNIMSEYIQTTVFGQPSRVQTEDMGDSDAPNRYSKAWNGIVVAQIPHNAHDDVFCKLIPFWQLELYFGKVLGKTPREQTDKGGFYPDVYEYIRTHDDLSTAGEQQLEFVYIASLCSETNLLDFFEKWGFLTPCDLTLDDYGEGKMSITQSQIDNLKTRVEALGYPKMEFALEYITDNNYETFKNKSAIVKGTAVRDDNRLTMENWQHVVVYEVREDNSQGELICVSDGVLEPSTTASFTVSGGWKDTYHVYAVSYDNQRIEVEF